MDYTSVTNIEKVINPLFMDDLWTEYDKVKDNVNKLNKLWVRISKIKIFDPACGSGNFLIITYKRLRELEREIIRTIDEISPTGIGIRLDSQIKLDHFFGIELEDFPRELAVLSMYIAAHQMNIKFEEEFGKKLTIIPIIDMPTIICGNSARLDWNSVCPNVPRGTSSNHKISMFNDFNNESGPQEFEAVYDEIYVIGNPPYKGADKQTAEQKKDLELYFSNEDYSKNMDYIGLWFIKGARYIQNTLAELCFVSTNSACQGEHVGIIFPKIFRANVEIGFAYTSFKWTNNAKDQAGVSVIIVSLRNRSNKQKYLYTGDITEAVYNISPYLVPGDDLIIYRRPKPFSSDFPEMNFGSMPRSKALVLTTEEKNLIISHDPNARKFIRRYVGAEDYLNGKERFCIWVPESDYSEADKIQELHNRFEIVREERLKSKAASTKKLADKPYRFVQISYKDTQSIIVPGHTSERRTYIPMGILSEEEIISNAAFAIYDAELWLFSILQSRSHMAWIKSVCGYLGTGIRYAKQLGYNTFPIPLLNLKQKEQLSNSAMDILMAREKHTEMTLAQMYDPDKMPEDLRNAHDVNDLLVDKLYQDKAFLNDEERLVKLLSMYEELTKDKK